MPLNSLASVADIEDITIRLQYAIVNLPTFLFNSKKSWAALDAALTRPAGARIGKVTIALRTSDDVCALAALLPATRSRGVLFLKVLDDDEV